MFGKMKIGKHYDLNRITFATHIAGNMNTKMEIVLGRLCIQLFENCMEPCQFKQIILFKNTFHYISFNNYQNNYILIKNAIVPT